MINVMLYFLMLYFLIGFCLANFGLFFYWKKEKNKFVINEYDKFVFTVLMWPISIGLFFTSLVEEYARLVKPSPKKRKR